MTPGVYVSRYPRAMETAARFMIIAGIAIAITGAALLLGAKAGLGRLPGDILVERDNGWIAIPIATSIILSIVLTVVLNIVVRFWR